MSLLPIVRLPDGTAQRLSWRLCRARHVGSVIVTKGGCLRLISLDMATVRGTTRADVPRWEGLPRLLVREGDLVEAPRGIGISMSRQRQFSRQLLSTDHGQER